MNTLEKDEGFKGMPYKDNLGYWTIGKGTKLPITKKEATLLLNYRLNKAKIDLHKRLPLNIDDKAWDILYMMAYQMGVDGVLGFHDMIKALKKKKYGKASVAMLDSIWAKKQTPKRAKRMAKMMKGIK